MKLHRWVLVTALVVVPGTAGAQQASPYLPLDHWAAPIVEHLIQSGVMADPLPLTRPFRRAEVVAALERVDTLALAAGVRSTVRWLLSQLADRDTLPRIRFEAYLGGGVGTDARRSAVRAEGNDYATPYGGALAEATWGSVVLSSHGLANRRLNFDPDYKGRQDRWMGGRFTDAYVSAQGRYAELTFGAVSRNWGPPGVPGGILSNEPYSYDHLFLRVGSPRFRLEAIATELDPMDVVGQTYRRFYAASRLVVTPNSWFTGSVSQATLWSGVGRGAEPWWINPLKLTTQTQQDESDSTQSNSILGLAVRFSLPRGVVLQGDFALDDLAFILSSSNAPDRVAGSLVADVPIQPRVSLRASYSLVSSLAYRSSEGPDQSIMRRGVGLGHNFADYTQLTLQASVLPWKTLVLTPELVWLKQGEGDFRLPFPPLPATNYPFLYVGTVETTLRAGLQGSVWLDPGLWVRGDIGLNARRNAGQVAGATATDVVARIAVTYHLQTRGRLPQ